MRKKLIIIGIFAIILMACSHEHEGIIIEKVDNKYQLIIDGKPTFIKGIGGINNLELARKSGANAFRTWGGDVESVKKIVEAARANDLYVMQGIALTKDSAAYHDEKYKSELRKLVTDLANTYKDDPNLIIWGIGNEIDLGKANTKVAWSFVDELAQIIKSIDRRHLVSSVIAQHPAAMDSLAKYAPTLDLIGINSYGYIGYISEMVKKSSYNGAYLITEWGPSGWWEMPTTEWKAPIEQTSEEKRIVYKDRYNNYILGDSNCLGSFVFLWGQKEERTPTWFSMFVESHVDGLPLKGEKTPMVEVMQRVWKNEEPEQYAPVIENFTVNGKKASENVRITAGLEFTGLVKASDKNNDQLSYVWEVLKEASVLGFGGAFEPRPERVGEVVTTKANRCFLSVNAHGDYRLYVYVLDNTGFVATANIPFQIKD